MRTLKVVAVAFLLAAAITAQDYRARVQGIVTDSSDAAVPGAKVTLRNNGTGISATRTSGPNGAYLFDNVEPGTYTVSAEFAGFLAPGAGERPGADARRRDRRTSR